MEKVFFSKSVSYGSLPTSIATDRRLGAPAFRLAFWLASRPNGWQPWRKHIMRELGMGVEMWQNACRQLEACGYLIRHGQHNQNGRFGGMRIEFNPSPLVPSPAPDAVTPSSDHAAPVTGLPDHGGPVTRLPGHLTTKSEIQKIKETPPPPPLQLAVVVDSLIFPQELGAGLSEVLIQTLQPIPDVEKKQELLDELAAHILNGKVRSPVGLLRKLVSLHQEGTLICELAPLTKQKRVLKQVKPNETEKLQTSGTSPTALIERQKLKEIKRNHLKGN
jgi:hypothetical protein